uniref:Uncharacterized protein n=1 Tax=viral metagenome TaxID=1070528 RepID=A0A6C0LF98_9ZZZZ
MKSDLPAFLHTMQQGILLDILENGLENGLELKFKTLFCFSAYLFPNFKKVFQFFLATAFFSISKKN